MVHLCDIKSPLLRSINRVGFQPLHSNIKYSFKLTEIYAKNTSFSFFHANRYFYTTESTETSKNPNTAKDTSAKTNETPHIPTECFLQSLDGSQKGIFVLSLNRPSSKNAIGYKLIEDLKFHTDELKANKNVRSLIIKSDVSNVFCAGADLKERLNMKMEDIGPFVKQLRLAFTEVERLPFPVISAIDGLALGGGLELALATDIRIASENSKLGLPETQLAIIPAAGGTQRLPRLIGIAKAKELIFSARVIDAREALNIGLINKLVPSGTSYQAAVDMANDFLKKGPIALKMAKLALIAGTEVELNSGLSIEEMCYAQVIPTEDRTEALKAFTEHRKPIFMGK